MQRIAIQRRWLRPRLFVLFLLASVLAACQPVAAPTETAAQSVPAATLPPTLPAAPTATGPASAPHILREYSLAYPSRLIWSADGQRLAVFFENGLTLLNAETLAPIATRSFPAPSLLLDFSPDGKTLAFTPDGKTIELEDIDTGQSLRTLNPGGSFQRAVFSPDGRWLAVDSTDQLAYTLWDVASGQKGVTLSGFVTAAPIYSADFSPSGRKFIWYARGSIQVMDIASATLAREIGHEDFISAFALSPDDSRLATAAGGTLEGQFIPLIHLWNPQNGEQIGVYAQAKFASALVFSPDDATLAVGSGGDVLLLDPASGQVRQSFQAADDAVTALAYAPDGNRLATASSDGRVRLWALR